MSKVGTATKEELTKAKAALDRIFYSPDFIMGSLPKLWGKVKESTDIPFRVTKGYYDNQAVVQMFKPLRKPGRDYPIQTTRPLNIIFMDTMVIDDYYIINTIDLFSKFASSTVFKKPVTSQDAVKALKEFLDASNSTLDSIQEIRVDGGPEWQKDFQEYTEDLKVTSLPYAKTEMSPIERYNGTLRRMIEKLKLVQGKGVSYAYKYVPTVVKAYNNLVHSSTGYTPSQILKDKQIQKQVLTEQRKYPQIDGIKKGDTVRVSIRNEQNVFDRKIAPNWSKELYKVTTVRGNRVTLENGDVFKGHQVLVIDPDLLMNTEKVRIVSETEKPEVRLSERGRSERSEQRTTRNMAREKKQIAEFLQDPEGRPSRLDGKRVSKPNPRYAD